MSTVVNLQTYTTRMDYTYSRHSNSAGAPLPHIPRRTSSSRSSVGLTAFQSTPSPPPATISRVLSADATYPAVVPIPTVLVVSPSPPQPQEPAATHEDEASSSSSSGSESYVQMYPRAKRTRTPRMQPFRSAADSTPTPAVLKARSNRQGAAFPVGSAASGDDTPRASTSFATPKPTLRVDVSDEKTPSTSLAAVARPSMVRTDSNRIVSAPHIDAAKSARKKSGEPLKSSLKSRRPVVRGDLSVVTGVSLTKSEPTTPVKSVHFDSRLEQVKLFLAEQKPLAISREGSPTDDTSGTESDFPSSIYGSKKDEDMMLTMTVTNMPAAPRADADIALEELKLSEDGLALNGRVRVRNIAFEKWVAVRFTVDYWQTTSEVTAKYLESTPGGVFDRFSFAIRLGDMLARIEEKTMYCALRYNVAGREIWDNNGGMNYKATFAKVPRPRPASPSTPTGNLSSLKSKLENVVNGQETVGSFMAQGTSGIRKSSSAFTLEASTSLAARYDFSASLRSPWTRSPPTSVTPTKSGHARNVTYPNTLSYFPKRGAMSKQAMVEDVRSSITRSPRLVQPDSPLEQLSASFYGASNASAEVADDSLVPIMSRRRSRNHQRGYFDIGLAQTGTEVKRTPPGTPVKERGARLSSENLALMAKAMEAGASERPTWFLERGGSEESTPSVTSNSESSLQSSPSGSPTDERVFGFGEARGAESESYSSFLNKYCYYTGNESSFLDVGQDVIHRSHSASSVEEFLSMSPSPSYMLSPGETPTRSPSYDDVASISSGSTTPTMRTAGFAGLMDSPSMVSAAR
ncbi:putative phosphatase regulatory subunit-domain-containing protein [Dichomitus squalens]|uniref:Putative phosphatase regulatory subunit-domain-containing protein n=1 Tax=Dichomitus squalens TaxID=114155 RepID=A0A4V2K3W7_9APHY|nr:putative phosphatase regulatory subunit-domain-containing protein [Dichomitus squalens]TBU55191.1 putative phosphatase regulatory subunit-domain-containing protein [Dichomitus squalens]